MCAHACVHAFVHVWAHVDGMVWAWACPVLSGFDHYNVVNHELISKEIVILLFRCFHILLVNPIILLVVLYPNYFKTDGSNCHGIPWEQFFWFEMLWSHGLNQKVNNFPFEEIVVNIELGPASFCCCYC